MFTSLGAEQWLRFVRRVAIVGPPNSWKTTSIWHPTKGWPRPLHIISLPGEHGAASIQTGNGVTADVWEEDEKPISAIAMRSQVIKRTLECLATPGLQTLVLDGFHKLYGIIFEAELEGLKTAYPNQDEETLTGRAYGGAHKITYQFIRKLHSSTMPYTVVTFWAGREKDNPDDNSKKPSMHQWPDLPGQMAMRIVGEFGLVLFSKPGQEIAPGRYSPGTWQTRPQGTVWGAGMKLPPEIAAGIPTIVPQDWPALEKLFVGTATS